MPALDDKLAENKQLLASYKRQKRADRKLICLEPPYGDRLHDFIGTVQSHFTSLEHGERRVKYVQGECRKWLRDAPIGIRHVALEVCGEREMAIRVKAGLEPMDDALPGEPETVFRKCRLAILG
jgi:hypothetical protein